MKLESEEIKELAAEIAKLFSKRSWVDNTVRLLPILGILGWIASYEIQRWSSNVEAQERAKLEQVRFDENMRLQKRTFEVTQIQADIERRIATYDKVHSAITGFRSVWQEARERCTSPHPSLTGLQQKRLIAEDALVNGSYLVELNFGKKLSDEAYGFGKWQYQLKLKCSKNMPSDDLITDKQDVLMSALMAELRKKQDQLKQVSFAEAP